MLSKSWMRYFKSNTITPAPLPLPPFLPRIFILSDTANLEIIHVPLSWRMGGSNATMQMLLKENEKESAIPLLLNFEAALLDESSNFCFFEYFESSLPPKH